MMKKYLLMIVCVLLSCFALTACGEEGIKVNEENFPDENFRKAVSSKTIYYDRRNRDVGKVLTEEEIAKITSLYVSGKNISDLTGIEYFVNLKELSCAHNQLTKLDLSKNKELTKLVCDDNQLTELNLTQNKKLSELECHYNQLTQLDLSQNRELTKLECSSNKIKHLNLSNNGELTYLSCCDGQLESLNIRKCVELEYLFCYNNKLEDLDVSNCTKLRTISCKDNELYYVDISNNGALTNYSTDFAQFYEYSDSTSKATKGDIKIGMSKSQVKTKWGEPIEIDKTTSSRGTKETWWYKENGNAIAVNFDVDGKVWLITE